MEFHTFIYCKVRYFIILYCTVTYYHCRYMNGVDRIDQMISYYPFVRKTRKWSKKVFWWLVELAMGNALIIYNHHREAAGERKVKLYDFQLSVIKELCYSDLYEVDEEGILHLQEGIEQPQVIYCTELFCTSLYCTSRITLFYIVLYCYVMYCTVLYDNVLYFTKYHIFLCSNVL